MVHLHPQTDLVPLGPHGEGMWQSLTEVFVAKFDVPGASGKQTSILDNLTPNSQRNLPRRGILHIATLFTPQSMHRTGGDTAG